MNVLVLGGNGFIGSHLVDKLITEGHNVRVLDKYEERYRKPLDGVVYYIGDFGNRGILAEALTNVDIVFHLVSTSLPKTSNDDPAYDVQSNVIETLFLLEECIKNKIKKIVYSSSGGTVYGKPTSLPIAETSPTDPECSYGITKLTIEKYLSLFYQLYGLDYSIIRPSNPFGSRQNPTGIQGAISVFLGRIAQNQSIEIWGDGEVVRDYIYVEDLVDGIYKASILETNIKIFNMGSGVGYSLNEIVQCISEVCGREVKVNYTAKRTFDVPKIFLDISRAKQVLMWKPRTSLKDGIHKTWEFILTLG